MGYCEKCGRTMDDAQFYRSNNLEKYPNNGQLNTCKKCTTLHVNNWDPETFKPILQEIDVPYIKEWWDELLVKYGKDPTKITGMTIMGRYLAKMRLNQYKEYKWADNERLREELDQKKRQSMLASGYSGEEIEAELARDHSPARPDWAQTNPIDPSEVAYEEEPDDFADELTDEDRLYLRMKWGKGYRPEEWIKMEQLYEDMMASYDIQGAGHKDTLIMICKTSLKANQLIDMGDVEGFQKMSKVYDQLMKSGKFTAAQNKGESGEFIDSIGELVAICERDGFIPRYYVDGPQDKVDRTLEDLQGYTKTLIMEEMNLGNMIESSMKEIMADKEREAQIDADNSDEDDAFEAQLFSDQSEHILTDEDFVALREMEEEQEMDDVEYLESLLGE